MKYKFIVHIDKRFSTLFIAQYIIFRYLYYASWNLTKRFFKFHKLIINIEFSENLHRSLIVSRISLIL